MDTNGTRPAPMGTLLKYFGKKSGQSLVGFKGEMSELTDEDRTSLARGIANGTLTY